MLSMQTAHQLWSIALVVGLLIGISAGLTYDYKKKNRKKK